MRTLSVAALQTAPVARDAAATLALFGERLAGVRAVVPGVDLVLAPELHLSGQPGLLEEQSGYPDEVAVQVPGPLTDAISVLAREHRVWLVPGTVFERADDGQIHNTALAFSPAGELVARNEPVGLVHRVLRHPGCRPDRSGHLL